MRQRFLYPILIFILCAGCMTDKQTVRHPDQLTFQPLEFTFPEVERFQTANGMRVFFREDRELPLITITAVVAGGSLEVVDEKTGLGDLFQEMLRSGGAGSHSPDELEETLETMGADLSVETDSYATTLSLSVRKSDIESGAAILSDLLRSPRFDVQRLELARQKAIEGIRRRNDFPGTVAHRSLRRWLYQGHPLGREASIASVSNVTREDLLAFHRRHFHPHTTWLAVSGDLSREALEALLARSVSEWPRKITRSVSVPPLPQAPEPVLLLSQKALPQTTILMGARGIDKTAPDLAAVQVMNFILGGGGFNSRLMREIRSNRGLAYSVYSYFQIGRRLPGLFIVGSETKSDSTLEVVNLIKKVMKEMQTSEVSAEELRLARESLINSFIFAFTDTHGVVTRELRLAFYDYPEGYLENYRDRIADVTAADVLEAARRYLNPAKLTIALVGDEKKFDASASSLGLKVKPVVEEAEMIH